VAVNPGPPFPLTVKDARRWTTASSLLSIIIAKVLQAVCVERDTFRYCDPSSSPVGSVAEPLDAQRMVHFPLQALSGLRFFGRRCSSLFQPPALRGSGSRAFAARINADPIFVLFFQLAAVRGTDPSIIFDRKRQCVAGSRAVEVDGMKRRDVLRGMLAAPAAEILGHGLPNGSSAWATSMGAPRELFPGAYQIASLFGERNLFQYLLLGDTTILFDTGIASTPQSSIFPCLQNLHVQPERITLAIDSHADGDHQGGNFAVKRASPRTLLVCGSADQAMIEDPQVLWELRYNFLKADYGVGIDPIPSPDAGKPQRVDLCFDGNETITIRSGWQVEVLHVPGHSRGHLALYDRAHRAAFIGDAVHGRGCPKAAGGIALPVTYYYVDAYLSTIGLLENLPIDTLYTAHWPTMRGEEIRGFFAESRQTVTTFDEVVLTSLRRNPSGVTLRQLIGAIGDAFSDWPKDTLIFAMFAIKGHMDRLEAYGKVRLDRSMRPFRWVAAT
jgi:glyoxylase-like metal-dependent hydrolase (beta-lactamase superfamily II)